MHVMDIKVEATCPNNWDDSDIANPDMIKEEGFNEAIKSELELEESDLHDYPLAIKGESIEHSDGIELEVEVINPYTIKEEGDIVAFKSESEFEGNYLDDGPTATKGESLEYSDGAGSEIEAYTIKDEGNSVAFKSELELEGNDLNDDPTTVKYEAVECMYGAASEIVVISSDDEEDDDDDSNGNDSDDFGAAVILVPRRPSGPPRPPNSGGAEQQMYAPEPESPTRTSPNRRRKHGVADLSPTSDQPRSKMTRLGNDMIDEEPVLLYAAVLENSRTASYLNRSVEFLADEEEYVEEKELCMSRA
ncbi:hypothetical protein BKA59DRAFT_467891 [Fusarium tricinctum]|uniref:Uncharacterized protein n=1 Tax=Fusarium tricinctum TaxID=61284 RepID=A0A8K0S0F4_9HYPO|nr:hypothetical protein BKA59DRAFT_467891 [Fusarium tricinctum]